MMMMIKRTSRCSIAMLDVHSLQIWSCAVVLGRRLHLGLYSNRSTSSALGRHHETVGISINQSYFICQREELHTINYNFVNISTCGRLSEKLQSSSSWSPIVTMRMHTVLINHAHTHTHTHTHKIKTNKNK